MFPETWEEAVRDGYLKPVKLEVELIAKSVPQGALQGGTLMDLLAYGFAQSRQSEPKARVVERYGLHHGHSSPLEFAWFEWQVRGFSRAGLAQLTRHRLASYEVESQRYCDYEKELRYVIPPEVEESPNVLYEWNRSVYESWRSYVVMRAAGVPKEDARGLLPMFTACNFVFGMNLRSLLNFWKLRSSYSPDGKAAQWEIRKLADETLEDVLGELPEIRDGILEVVGAGIRLK